MKHHETFFEAFISIYVDRNRNVFHIFELISVHLPFRYQDQLGPPHVLSPPLVGCGFPTPRDLIVRLKSWISAAGRVWVPWQLRLRNNPQLLGYGFPDSGGLDCCYNKGS